MKKIEIFMFKNNVVPRDEKSEIEVQLSYSIIWKKLSIIIMANFFSKLKGDRI